MTTIALKSADIVVPAAAVSTPGFNRYALFSGIATFLFLSYFLVPHQLLWPVYQHSLLFLIVMPLIVFILSLIAMRQMANTRERGKYISYLALALVSFYFIISLAVPFVLIGYYIVYAYVL